MKALCFWVKFITVAVISVIAIAEVLSSNNTYANLKRGGGTKDDRGKI